MKIIDIINGRRLSLSFEVFPPKSFDNLASVRGVTEDIASLMPGYMSVTCGAGGSTDKYTPEIDSLILNSGVTPLAHITCISSDREGIQGTLDDFSARGVENLLALRGDVPQGFDISKADYRHASELIAQICEYGGFCIGGACYPEGHPESASLESDIDGLKIKVDAGCEFLTTQMFFDNEILYRFKDRLDRAGIDAPLVPGIMPVTNAKQIGRIISISGNALPSKFMKIIDRYGDNPAAMLQAGVAFATEQIVDLYASGFNAVHVYSMNKPTVARAIRDNVKDIIEMSNPIK